MQASKGITSQKGIKSFKGIEALKGIGLPPSGLFNPAQVAGLSFGFDVADTDTITTDLAGTTPVTADAQLVRYVGDQSANGYNATQAVDANRTTYKTDGTYHWLEFNGTTQKMDLNPAYDGAVGSDNWACFGVRVTNTGFRLVIGGTNDDGLELIFSNGLIRPYIGTVSGDIGGNGSTNTVNTDIVFTVEWNRTAGTLKGWVNGVLEVNLSGIPANKLNGAAAWLGVGGTGTAAYFQGRQYTGWVFDEIPSDTDKARIEAFVAARRPPP